MITFFNKYDKTTNNLAILMLDANKIINNSSASILQQQKTNIKVTFSDIGKDENQSTYVTHSNLQSSKTNLTRSENQN
jgi:hypothetical protein